jgi:uncharacterized damage-inducible protein DinB
MVAVTAKKAQENVLSAEITFIGIEGLVEVGRFCMTKDDIQLLFEYDRWANERMLQAVSALASEQFTRHLDGSFSCLRDAVAHIIGGQWIWLAYWKATMHGAALLEELRMRREAQFNADVLPNAVALVAKCKEVETEIAEFLNAMTDQNLERTLPARNTSISLAHLMQHVANHSTYHRGQVALMLREIGAEPAPTDFHVFLAEGHGGVLPA